MTQYSTLEQVKIRLKQFHIDDSSGFDVTVFDSKEENPLLEQLIDQARKDVISRRNYPDNYTQDQINADMKKFEGVIVNLTVYDRSQAGEAYMSAYTENGVQRNWVERDSLLSAVFPFVKVL